MRAGQEHLLDDDCFPVFGVLLRVVCVCLKTEEDKSRIGLDQHFELMWGVRWGKSISRNAGMRTMATVQQRCGHWLRLPIAQTWTRNCGWLDWGRRALQLLSTLVPDTPQDTVWLCLARVDCQLESLLFLSQAVDQPQWNFGHLFARSTPVILPLWESWLDVRPPRVHLFVKRSSLVDCVLRMENLLTARSC